MFHWEEKWFCYKLHLEKSIKLSHSLFTHISARFDVAFGLESRMNSIKICPNTHPTTISKLQCKSDSNVLWLGPPLTVEKVVFSTQQQKSAQSSVAVAVTVVHSVAQPWKRVEPDWSLGFLASQMGRSMGEPEIRAEKTLQKSKEKEKSRFNKYFP